MPALDLVIPFPSSISLTELNQVSEQGMDFLSRRPSGDFILNLDRVSGISSLAIGFIIRLHNHYCRQKRRMILRNVSANSYDIFESTGLVNVLTIERNPSAPLQVADSAPRPALSVKLDFEFSGEVGI